MKICEIFRSLQGEGQNQGRPCVFVRLSGCNLSCSWCDTQYARENGIEMTIDAVLDSVWRLNGTFFCITGGEPLLQGGELLALVKRLSAPGHRIEIETNGTMDFRYLQPFASITMDVKCPSSGEESDLSLLKHIRPIDSVKFVVADLRDCRFAADIIERASIAGEMFVSPVYGSNYAAIAEFVLSRNLPVRFQLQLHKIIGVK
jgi:7-carboxy-7-deazaguanine synthase